jgi:hypothetical protein
MDEIRTGAAVNVARGYNAPQAFGRTRDEDKQAGFSWVRSASSSSVPASSSRRRR